MERRQPFVRIPLTMLDGHARGKTADKNEWFDWLLRTRHGADDNYSQVLQQQLDGLRDGLLDHANVRPGQHVVDLGSGDGLVAFGVLAREPTAVATFVDVSPALISYTQRIAERSGLATRCRFVVASAESLAPIPDASVDVVTARAVIAYLSDKLAALRECRRILRPGGRISIVDPIFADQAYVLAGIANQLQMGQTGAATAYFTYLHRCLAEHLPDTLDGIRNDPLTNYTERDLVRFFEAAGFVNVHLRLHIDSVPAPALSWRTYLATSPRAGVATIAEILQTRFSRAERIEFERLFRPLVEAGTTVERNVNAYIYADNV